MYFDLFVQEGAAFIQDVIANLEASKQPDMQQPILYLRMQLAQYALVQGHLQVGLDSVGCIQWFI
jgi:hypothetical protein